MTIPSNRPFPVRGWRLAALVLWVASATAIPGPVSAQVSEADGEREHAPVQDAEPRSELPADRLADEEMPDPTVGTASEARLAELGLVPGRPFVRPHRVAEPPEIDGRLDDAVWRRAARLTDFVQQSPRDGAPATEETEAYVAYDGDHLYFAFHVHYEDPSIMRANRVDRDRAFADDLVTVYLDPFLDQQRGYDFDVNAYGVQGDGIIGGGGGGIPRADRSWDALFDAAGEIVDDGFTAEMAIPFKSLRYPQRGADEPHRWGLQIVREIKGKDEENVVWAPMSRDESSFFAQMGLLEGMTGLSTSRNLEILPTFTAVRQGEIDETVPAFVDRDVDPDGGVNVKYGLTSDLTADFTVNPDFSQIESDQPQIEVNRRFPIYFDELRPFFLEGAEIFQVSAPVSLVHTRTVVDPDYGAKLTGKAGPVALGVMAANDVAPGRVDDPEDPAFGSEAHTYVGRAKVDLYSESHLGALVTDREFLDGHSRLGAVDGNLRLGRTRSFDFSAAGTRHRDPGEVEEAGGHLLNARLRQSARHLSWTLRAYQISPDFRTEAGFVRRTDQRRTQAEVRYRFWPESWVINWGPRVSYSRNWDFDGVLQDEALGMDLNASFARNVNLNLSYDREMERFGGIDFEKSRLSLGGRVNASRTFSLGANLGVGDAIRYTDEPFLGDEVEWRVNATVRPLSRLSSRLNLDASRLTDPRSDREVFDVKILRAYNTLQVTDRLALRNITEYNTFDEALGLNLLFTYRVNAGTVVYAGYDDRYRRADRIEGDPDGDGIDEPLFAGDGLQRTNRALFLKMQYLFRM